MFFLEDWSQEALQSQPNNVGLDSNPDLDANPGRELDEYQLLMFVQDEGQWREKQAFW